MYQSSGNEKEGCCLFFPSSTKREIWHFHVVVVQRRQEVYKKSMMHKVLFDQSKTIAFLPFSLPSSLLKLPIREFTQRWRRRQQGRQKGERFRLAKQQLCKSITLFCTFLYRHCTTTTWNCQISRFVEDGKKRQQLSFSFPELWCSYLKFNFTKNLPTFDELNEVE